jgi:uncharacterized protein
MPSQTFVSISNNMHYLFYLGHPAHFHLFKNTIKALETNGHKISVLIKKKDILETLLKNSGINYVNILPEGRKDSRAGIAGGMVKRDFRLLRYCLGNRPDLMIGTSTEIGHIGSLLRIPSINVNEDDADVVPLYSKISYPWSTYILSPDVCNNRRWEKKSIKHKSYHELAYLHPYYFTPSRQILRKYMADDSPYFLMRFARLNAHHDKGITGITDELAERIINSLKPYGRIYLTSERSFDERFEKYKLDINPLDIHHLMAFAAMFIGDSQTMAAEAGVLGVPFVRFNDFVGKLSYLNELEEKYQLGYGIKTSEPERLQDTIRKLLTENNTAEVYQSRRKRMLSEKISLTDFMIWVIGEFPESTRVMEKDPSYQLRFK